jgi:hypothetical protein
MQVTAQWNRINLSKLKANHKIGSDRQLALQADIPPNTLQHQLRHDRPTLDVLLSISNTYGITVDQLIHKVPRDAR